MKIIINQRNTHFWTAGWACMILCNLPNMNTWIATAWFVLSIVMFVCHFVFSNKINHGTD